jgi:outer membrane murein-binding lipoprotein Lpp
MRARHVDDDARADPEERQETGRGCENRDALQAGHRLIIGGPVSATLGSGNSPLRGGQPMKTIVTAVLVVALATVAFASAAATAPKPSPQVKALKLQVAKLKKDNGQLRSRVASLTRQRGTLKTQVASLTSQRSALTTQVTTLNEQVATLTGERDTARAEATSQTTEVARLRNLIRDDVHTLADAWRNDNNARTDVSKYEATDYWSYSFTFCGFCSP